MKDAHTGSFDKFLIDVMADPAWQARRAAIVETERRQFWRRDVPVGVVSYLALVFAGILLRPLILSDIPLLPWLYVWPLVMSMPVGYLLCGLYPRFS